MESGEAPSTGAGTGQAALPPSEAHTVPPSPLATLTVVVEVELRRESGPEEIQSPLLLEEPKSIRLFPSRTLENQEQCFTFDRVLGLDAAQEAEQELLARVKSTLALVGKGYSVALILRGRETEAPRLVPQLLQELFEEALLLHHSDCMLSTLSLVQISPSGRTQDLLSPGLEDLSMLEVAPLGLVVEGASEVDVSDSRAASELYLQVTGREARTCCLLTLTVSCPGPDPPEGSGTQGVWRGVLRILQLPGALHCPLLRVLAGEVVGEEMEGSLPWIISQLLEGNNYSGLLLRLDPQGSSLSLLQGALLGASERRMQVKQIRPILWNVVEEARARRAGLKTLRLGLLGLTLTDERLSQMGRALRELQVVKALGQYPRSPVSKEARAEVEELPGSKVCFLIQPLKTSIYVGLPLLFIEYSIVQGKPWKYCEQKRQHYSHLADPEASHSTHGVLTLYPGYRLFKASEVLDIILTDTIWVCQAPDVALQFILAQARRQRLQEQHQSWIQEELKHMGQEEVAGEQIKGPMAEEQFCEERQRWLQEQTVLRLQVEALQAERNMAEQDLAAFYDLHVKATRAQTCHMLQVFRAWQGLWQEKATTTEHHLRSLLASVLQDTIDLASQNQELQAQNQQLRLQQCASEPGTVTLGPCPGEKPGDLESFKNSFLPPHSWES
ncbi:uncharacterized protein LOC100735033 [Cavia porcellus]|uniref:uncharacterized protein LOC100735033 n=1 Tax=Cavia porcellus TaxID=10141 RepID=UPI002FE28AC8